MPSKKSAKKAAAKVTKPSPADAIDTQLARYRSMRDFNTSAEPSGEATPKAGNAANQFCIQKHAASHLHYDFRLGWNGVLKSWACAKGPSYVVKDKRLAVQVEDHPMEYGGFEGIIPAGQYGGGTVMLWDQGTWTPQPGHEDVDAGLREGNLKFTMDGTKMHGKWALIRMAPRPKETKPAWLLIKEHDDFERTPEDPAVTDTEPNSVVTGRSLEQIAASHDHVWNSNRPETRVPHLRDSPIVPKVGLERSSKVDPDHSSKVDPERSSKVDPERSSKVDPERSSKVDPERSSTLPQPSTNLNSPGSVIALDLLDSLPKEHQPTFLKPQLAQETEAPPEGPAWIHELKLDGYRMQARKEGAKVQMLTRSGLDWTDRVKSVAAEVARLPIDNITLDGEVVVLAENGTTNFADLQASFQEGARNPLTYFCFDLLHLAGHNPRALPLTVRKELLTQALAHANPDHLQVSEHLTSNGAAMFLKACELHAEGIVSKKGDAPYTEGRTNSWLKSKCLHEQEFVIGGYTLPGKGKAGGPGLGALLLGYYDENQRLIYAGRTGTGFTQKFAATLRKRLETAETSTSPFLNPSADARRGAIWVRPSTVAQVRFATWTADQQVRQAAFLGLREDKPASEVRRELAAPTPKESRMPQLERRHPQTEARVPHLSRSPIATEVGSQKPASPQINLPHAPVRLTHPQKILDPTSQLTKQQLADYYWAVAPAMLPHIIGRAISLVRLPNGIGQESFYQKNVSSTLPPGFDSVPVPDKKTGVIQQYVALSTPEAIASLAQMSVLEVHPWGSLAADLERPDRLVIDLDPDESLAWPTVTAAALEVRAALKKLGLESWVKTTGGKGLHVVLPITANLAYPDIKTFCQAFVKSLERANPKLYLTVMTKAARTGKIYLDYLRNERGATAVAPYSPRARANVGVAVPLAWSELKSPTRPLFNIGNLPSWRARLKKDPWAKLPLTNQSITPEAGKSLGLK